MVGISPIHARSIASHPAPFGFIFLAFPTKRFAKADFGQGGHDISYSARIGKYGRQSKAHNIQDKAPRSGRKTENKKSSSCTEKIYGESSPLAILKSGSFFFGLLEFLNLFDTFVASAGSNFQPTGFYRRISRCRSKGYPLRSFLFR